MTFVDTNVLVYAVSPLSPQHDRAVAAMEPFQTGESAFISRQVLREYVAVMTGPQQWSVPWTPESALADADRFAETFTLLEDGPHVWATLRTLSATQRLGGRQVHDAYLAATALAHGVTRVLTFNGTDFRRFTPLIEVIEP